MWEASAFKFMSIIGLLVVLAASIVLFTNHQNIPILLAAVVPFAATSAVGIFGQSVIPYHLVAILLVASSLPLILRAYRADLYELPGARPLIAFCVWSVIITVLSPRIFAGISVLDPRKGIDNGVKAPSILAPSISNFAQSGYLILAVLVVVTIAFHPRPAHQLPSIAFGLGTILCSLKGLLPQSVQAQVIDNSKNVAYTSGTFNGTVRMRGLFSEPSGLGAFSVAAFIFFAVAAARARGLQRYLYLTLAIWSFTNAALSYSGGAVGTALVVSLIILARGVYVAVSGRQQVSNFAVMAVVTALPIAAIVGPEVLRFVTSIIVDKSGSTSAENRSAADQFSFQVLEQTGGLGSGLGSNRPSSFLMSLSSNVGLLGVILLTTAIALIMREAFKDARFQPAVWSVIALLVAKVISGPDISEPVLWFLLGVCAQGAWQAGRPKSAPERGGVDVNRLTSMRKE